MAEEKLFQEFSSVTKEEWVAKATADLKGASFDKVLRKKTINNQVQDPYYALEDVDTTIDWSELKNIIPTNPDAEQGPREWVNYQRIVVENETEANKMALQLLEFSVTGLIFDLGPCSSKCKGIDYNTLLKDIRTDALAISFTNVCCSTELEGYFDAVKAQGVDPANLFGFVAYEPIARYTTAGKLPENWEQELVKVYRLTEQSPNLKAVTISGQEFVNAGGSHVQDIAFTLNKWVTVLDVLTEAGIDIKEAIGQTNFLMGVATDYFHELAKFRSLRLLAFELAKQYGVTVDKSVFEITAVSSLWSKSYLDSNVNMLRNTTEAMSAILGGVDAICIMPHNETFEKPTAMTHRVALNLSHMLKEESYFDRVVDPAAGSYYIDNLSTSLAKNALELFQKVETEGGFLTAFEAKEIQTKIAEVRDFQEKLIRQRRQVYVGANRYPNMMETLDPQKYQTTEANDLLLQAQFAGKTFEELRLATEQFVAEGNERPTVFYALYGNLAMRRARANFAGEFLSTAGFNSEEAYFDDAVSAANASAHKDADIVVICSSDDDYNESGEAFVKEFRANDLHTTLLLAGNPTDIEDKLKAAGLNGTVHVRTDIVKTLTDLQRILGIVK